MTVPFSPTLQWWINFALAVTLLILGGATTVLGQIQAAGGSVSKLALALLISGAAMVVVTGIQGLLEARQHLAARLGLSKER